MLTGWLPHAEIEEWPRNNVGGQRTRRWRTVHLWPEALGGSLVDDEDAQRYSAFAC
jgi:hypothetical protein